MLIHSNSTTRLKHFASFVGDGVLADSEFFDVIKGRYYRGFQKVLKTTPLSVSFIQTKCIAERHLCRCQDQGYLEMYQNIKWRLGCKTFLNVPILCWQFITEVSLRSITIV